MSTGSPSTPAVAQPAAGNPSPAASRNGERTPRQPEKKIGPFAGGVGVAIWLKQVETQDGGTRQYRSNVA